MSHTRFALGFTRNRKVFLLSDGAFRLWISSIDHAREQATDGEITALDLDVIPRCPKGKKRAKVVAELVACGLWETRGKSWQIHDFLDWQDSSKEVEEKKAAARERMRAVRANKSRTESEPAPNVPAKFASSSPEVRSGSGSGSGSGDLRSDLGGRSKDLTGQSDPAPPPGPRPRDRLAESFAPAHTRPDVAEVFAAWRDVAGQPNAALGARDVRAEILAERIDQHGVEACLRVLAAATQDPWHSGAKDGKKHMRIEQIFGRDSAASFDELLAEAPPDSRPRLTDAELAAMRREKAEREAAEEARARAELGLPDLDPGEARARVEALIRGSAGT